MDLLMADLNLALNNARNPALQLAIEISREFFSPSWHRMPALILRLREQIESNLWITTNYGYVDEVLRFNGEYELLRVLAEVELRRNPLDRRSWIK